MILQKWNYQTRKYEPYKVPDQWNCKEYSADMYTVDLCPAQMKIRFEKEASGNA